MVKNVDDPSVALAFPLNSSPACAVVLSKALLKEMVHLNVENWQFTPLQIAENINKMSKVFLKPSLL